MTESSADSEYIGSGQNTGSVSVPVTSLPSCMSFGVNRIDQGWRTSPIPFSDRLASLVKSGLVDCFQQAHPETFLFDDTVVSICGNEPKRFAMALQGYVKSRNPLIPLNVLINAVSDPTYASRLKKMRRAALTRSTQSVSNREDDLDDYLIPGSLSLSDIGQIFNYKYWFRWEEPDPESWKFGLIPLEEPGTDYKNKFKDALFEVLPDTCPIAQPEEVLASLSGSSTRTSTGRATKVFREKTIEASNYMSKAFLKGYRSTIYKSPTEVRDAVILPIAQSNTVKWIEKQMACLAKKTRYSAYGKSAEVFSRTLNDFYDRDCRYYNRDMTKEGITKPRWIIKAIGEVCKEKYPDNPIWDYFSIYEKYELSINGEWHSFPRGHGLGMANALTTIMQCGLFHAMKMEFDELPDDLDALFYNDDATIKGKDDVDILTYSSLEESFMGEAGLLVSEEKTYSSPVMILCERYFPETYNAKDSYGKYIRRIPFSATNIVVAKSTYCLLDDPTFGALEPYLLPLALSFWGCEWDQDEYLLPTFAGGWLSPKYKGIRLDFVHSEFPLNQLMFRGMGVGPPQLKPVHFRKEEGTFVHPIFQSVSLDLSEIDKSVLDLYDFVAPMSSVAAKFHRSLNDHETHSWLRKEKIRRYQAWSTPAKPMSIADIYCKVVSDNPLVDFIPPWELRHEVPLEDICIGDHREYPPDQPNKLLGSLSLHAGCAYIDKVIPYPYLPGVAERPFDLTPERLSKYRESIYAIPGVSQLFDPTRNYELNAVLTERHYCDDYTVWSAWKAVTGLDTYPRPLVRSRGGDIKHKHQKYLKEAEYYGTQEHWDFWTTYGRTIPVIHMFGFLSKEEWENILDECVDAEVIDTAFPDKSPQEEMITSHFGTYYAGYREGWRPPRYLENVFQGVKEILSRIILMKSAHSMASDRSAATINPLISKGIPPEGAPLDKIYKKLTGVVSDYSYHGLHLYSLPLPDVWGDDNESDDGFGGGLFDLPGD